MEFIVCFKIYLSFTLTNKYQQMNGYRKRNENAIICDDL